MPDNYNQEDFDQWDEDKVDLSFRTVADLHHLLTSRDLNLDFQLFRQSHEINQMLIKELNSVSTNPSDFLHSIIPYPSVDIPVNSSEVSSLSNSTEVSYLSSNTNVFDNSKISSSSLSSKKSSIFIQDADDNHLQLTNLSASTESTAILNYENLLSSEDIHDYSIICILLVLLLLFFLLLLLIILKCKTVCQKKYQVGKGKESALPSSYIKTSYSLSDNVSYEMTITSCQVRRSSKQAVMKIGEEHITGSHQIATPRPSFYSPVNYPPCSPSPFSTFHSPAKERTSPEGSSCGEADMEWGGHFHKLNSRRREEDKPSSLL